MIDKYAFVMRVLCMEMGVQCFEKKKNLFLHIRYLEITLMRLSKPSGSAHIYSPTS